MRCFRIPPALEKARVTSSASEAEYVSRPGRAAKINNFLDSKSTSYCVVYGAKGHAGEAQTKSAHGP